MLTINQSSHKVQNELVSTYEKHRLSRNSKYLKVISLIMTNLKSLLNDKLLNYNIGTIIFTL